MRRGLALACFVAAAAWATPCAADPADEAGAHLERGLRLYETQDYAEAITEFKEGYRIDPRPAFLYALAQAQRMSGDCRNAITAYRAFLRTTPARASRAAAESNIARCEEALRDPSSPGARAVGGEDATVPGELPVPEHKPPSALERVGETPRPAAPVTPRVGAASGPASHWYQDTLGDTLAISGIVVGLGGATLLVVGALEGNASGATYDEHASSQETAHTLVPLGVVGAALGAALIGAAVVRYATRSTQAPLSASLDVDAMPGALTMRVRGTF